MKKILIPSIIILIVIVVAIIIINTSLLRGESLIVDGTKVYKGDEFIVSHEDSCVDAIKYRLVDIEPDSIVVDILAYEGYDGVFRTMEELEIINNVEEREIESGTCFMAPSSCLDVIYSYCFDLVEVNSRIELSYDVRSKSIMPKPE